MTILFVLENYFPNIGGVETLFKSLVERLADNGHEVIVVTTQLHPEDARLEKTGNITIARYPFKNRYFFTFFAIFPIFSHIRKADIVHTTSYNAGLPAFFAAKLFRKKVIITFHEMWGDLWFQLPFMSGFGKRLHHLFEQFLIRLPFNKFVAVSESTADSLRAGGVHPKRVLVNYNGIDYSDFVVPDSTVSSKKENQFTYTYFGRIGVSKGLDLLLQAAKEVKAKHPRAVLKLIIPKEPAPFFKEIMGMTEEYGLTDVIEFHHHLSFADLKKELLASDCVVIPSYSEGFCFAAVEAIALGLPLISSNQKALKEVVCGKYINMKTLTKEALVDAVEQAMRGEWTETPIRKFELDGTVQRYIELYKSL